MYITPIAEEISSNSDDEKESGEDLKETIYEN